MKRPLIAVVDDDTDFARYLEAFLDGLGYDAITYQHGENLLADLHLGRLPEVVLLDVMMPGMDGLSALRSLKASRADVPVIMLSGREHASTIVEALRLGAENYVVKPGDPDRLGEIALEAALHQTIEKRRLQSELSELRRLATHEQEQALLWSGHAMQRIGTLVDRVADTDVTVLIRGESGVGKELVARAIHLRSARRTGPFVKVNCAALPDTLLESELFGHEKGAFTGAASTRIGKFEHASGGTLMLDEIGEMKAAMQSKLLHVLQDGEFNRLGGNKHITADVRVLAATNRDLEAMLQASEFREDLYYRLKVIEIVVPPLRERPDELPQLARFFTARYARQYVLPEPTLSPAVVEALEAHSWPGNIRELENMMKRFVILQDEARLLHDLRTSPGLSPALSEADAETARLAEERAGHADEHTAETSGSTAAGLTLPEVARRAALKAERDLMLPTLRRVHWNRKKAAPLLGVSYKTLLNKLKEHGIEPD